MHEEINVSATENAKSKRRVKELVEAAAATAGGYRQLAELLDVHPQLISNWKNGVKNPSAEAQAELAVYAGHDPVMTTFWAALEKTTGKRLKLLQDAARKYTEDKAALQKMRPKTISAAL